MEKCFEDPLLIQPQATLKPPLSLRVISMPHGDFSDLSALVLTGVGLGMMFNPGMMFKPLPMKPFFDMEMSAELEMMIRFCSGFVFILGCALFTVRVAAPMG